MLASLHSHDEYSLLDGAGTAIQHAIAARESGYVALANTNHATLAGSLHHQRACRESGVLPIAGLEAYYRPNRKVQGEKSWLKVYNHLTLLAKDMTGWRSLMRISSEAHKSGFYGRACIDDELLEKHREGLICLTGCLGGRLAKSIISEDHRQAEAWIRQLRRIFGTDLFVECMPHAIPEQVIANVEAVRIAERHGIGVVMTLDEHYPTEEWAPTQDVLLMIATNQTVKKREKKREEGEDVYEFFVKTLFHQTEEQIRAQFAANHPGLSQQVVDESLRNTLVVAGMCKPFLVDRSEKMPAVSFPGVDSNEDYLRRLSYEGLGRRGYADKREYKVRVDYELSVIVKLDSVDQILLAWDVVDWAKSDRPLPKRDKRTGELIYKGKKEPMMVGPGRGCLRAGSLVWTERGNLPIEDVVAGDVVRTHTGSLSEVDRVFEHKVCSEPLLRIRAYGDGGSGISMTKDHKVLVRRCERETNRKKLAQGYKYAQTTFDSSPEWVRADEVDVGDLLCVPRPKIFSSQHPTFDVSAFVQDLSNVVVLDDEIVETVRINQPHNLSIKAISRATGVAQNCLYRITSCPNDSNNPDGRSNPRTERNMNIVLSYVSRLGVLSLEEWVRLLRERSTYEVRTPRFISVNKDFCRLIGMWASNGWFTKDSNRVVGLAEQRSKSDDTVPTLVDRIWGLSVTRSDHRQTDLTQWEVRSSAVRALLGHIFDYYNYTAQTKHLPVWVGSLSSSLRRSLLDGLWWGDGSTSDRWSYSTTSPELMRQVRDLIWSSGSQASVSVDDRVDERKEYANSSRAWRITTTKDFGVPRTQRGAVDDNFIYQRVRSITSDGEVDRVYDLSVPGDRSFMTDSFVVHNSAASSAVCWAINLTNVNPIKHRLLFERFMNPDRVGKPDVDIDFSPDDIELIEKYVKIKYGEDRVLDVIAHSTFGPRAAINDVGRVLSIPQAHFRAATKTIDDGEKGHLRELRPLNPAIDRFATDYPFAWEVACLIQGSVARKSEHAGALLILPESAEECGIPVERKGGQKGKCLSAFGERAGKNNALLSDYGFVGKLDLLRVAELTKQKKCVQLIRETTGKIIDLDELPVHDDPMACEPEVMKTISDGILVGVFQLAATAVKLARQMKGDSIFDLSALNALVRPGPRGAGYDQMYARRKRGQEEITYWHPILEECLDFSLGIMVYQESLMEIVHKLGGLTLAQADIFRKIAAKLYRDPVYAREVMNEWYEPIKRSFQAHGISEETFGYPADGDNKATGIWGEFLSFTDYSFCLAHASGYSILAYRDAWLKTHYPRQFYAALLSCGLSAITKKKAIQKLEAVREARHMNLQVMPPDVNESGRDWTVVEDGIRLGLRSIKNIGPATCAAIEEFRPFESYEDFEKRVPRAAVNITARASLIMSGAFDRWKMRDQFTEDKIDECERDLLGMSLTSIHSIAAYADAIEGHFWTEDEFDEAEDGTRVAVVGEVSAIKEHVDKKQNTMCFIDLVYGPHRYSCTVFASLYEVYRDLIHSRRPLLVMGSKNTYNGRSSVRVESLPTTNDEDWMAPIVDLGMYVELIGDQEEQFVTDSIYPEDLDENLEQLASA